MAEKTLKTRIKHKIGTTANWEAATNFIPLAGELIIYQESAEGSKPKFKVGDGTTLVNSLPFSSAEPQEITNEEIDEICLATIVSGSEVQL